MLDLAGLFQKDIRPCASKYLTELSCRYIKPWQYWQNEGWHDNDGVDRWQLTQPFGYHSALLRREVWVPEGFRFDKASVPTLPVIYAMFGGRYTRPACVHDYLCRSREVKRQLADRIFLEAMRCENIEELNAMKAAGCDDDEISERNGALEGRAMAMYTAVSAYTKTGLWKADIDQPGFEPIG